ncbi:hypothetical protein I6F21_02525 [Bradyrhizobium sp. NBAIM03]|uniref:hypothetical protein n=1 Tax=Bradyrhizobium sp. NBAIM03 TaxID=2793816 RepID=UPI001CD285C6|nr:hypothetical protein [Bradyrhizobium sp. NBAIM03]MCA1531432.1 hypothetical protein [Bradyrhizobium sp. NBAIM03]
MDFSVFIIAAATLAVGIYIGRQSQKAALGSLARTADRKASAANEANDRYLEVLQRELANIIARDNPDKMIALYRKAKAQEREMLNADKARVQAELTALTHKYPAYEDFDKIGTKHFVPYSGEPLWGEEGEFSDAYLDISKFLILTRIQDSRSHRPIFPDDDDRSFQRCMQELKDRAFASSLRSAVNSYYLACRVAEQSGSPIGNYEDGQIGVFQLPSYADVRYGIHLKEANEYGIYSFFVHDDGKVSSRFSRSDASFENETALCR